jgi:hypothetical protein
MAPARRARRGVGAPGARLSTSESSHFAMANAGVMGTGVQLKGDGLDPAHAEARLGWAARPGEVEAGGRCQWRRPSFRRRHRRRLPLLARMDRRSPCARAAALSGARASGLGGSSSRVGRAFFHRCCHSQPLQLSHNFKFQVQGGKFPVVRNFKFKHIT